MRNIKNVLVVLLTLLLLAAGGLLPGAVARLQDKATIGTAQYEDIDALRLELEEEAVSISFLEKLYLLSNGIGKEVTYEKTGIKEEQILEVTYTALQPYMELFWGKTFDNDDLSYTPAVVWDENDPSRSAAYWHVTLSLDASVDDMISVILDDETGKLLAIEVFDPDFNIDPVYLQELQYMVAANYFGELGLTPVEEYPMVMNEKWAYDGSDAVSVMYLFVDTLYGEIGVEIGVRVDGFFIYIA